MTPERTRLVVGAGLGALVASAVAWWAPWQLSVLAAWDACAVATVGWTWLIVGRFDSTRTEAYAQADDVGRNEARLVLSGAAIASLLGAVLAVLKAKHASAALAPVLTVAGVLTVVVSWALVHTLFTVRYAHLYYDGDPGGIDFKSDDPPDILDFAYVAFTVGMTFQVSDTDIAQRSIRRTILRHALLSYLFGTVIVAITINVIAGFVR